MMQLKTEIKTYYAVLKFKYNLLDNSLFAIIDNTKEKRHG